LDKSREDIDLIHLLTPIMKGIGRFFHLIGKNLLTFVVIFFLAAGLTQGIQYIMPRSYATKGILVSRLLPVSYCNFLINGINSQINDHNISTIASELHISHDMAANIRRISSESMARDSGLLDKEDPDASGFEVEIILGNIEDLDSIQQGLVHYLAENEFARSRKEAQKKKLIALINRLSERMQSLDSLKKNLNNRYANAVKEHGIIFGEPVDPVSVYKEEMNYYKEKLSLNERLNNLDNPIEVFEPFVRQEAPNYPNLRPVLRLSLAAGVVLALIITPFYGWRRESKRPTA